MTAELLGFRITVLVQSLVDAVSRSPQPSTHSLGGPPPVIGALGDMVILLGFSQILLL